MRFTLRRVAPLFFLAAVASAILPMAQPAAAGGGSFTDPANDVLRYDYETDEIYEGNHHSNVDIGRVDVTTTADKVQVTTRVPDVAPGWWDAHEVYFDVNADDSDDFAVSYYPDGTLEIAKVYGPEGDGYPFACGGMTAQASDADNRFTVLVPRSCLANTTGVAVGVLVYAEDKASCCDWYLDYYPNGPELFSPRVAYDKTGSGTYDPDGPTGTIYRLYRAYFLREPDKGGYDYWLGVYRNGYPLDKISNDFARSAEFQKRYGAVDDRDFVTLAYNNVLGRVPDSAGYQYWVDQMNRGMLRGFVMIYFSDSKEFRMQTAAGRPPGY